MSHPMIEVENLRRTFARGRVVAVDNVSFNVGPGEIVAVLGSNGAGKTTLVKVLATLLRPDAGTATVADADVRRQARLVRSRISVVLGGDRGLYGRLSALDNVRFFGVMKGLSRRDIAERSKATLDEFGLGPVANTRVETFSRGMKQRLHLAIGMLGSPQVLMLDEPTTGLDVLEAGRVRKAVTEIAAEGTSVLLTSHNVADIERLASRVLVIRRGRLEQDMPIMQFRHGVGPVALLRLTVDGSLPTREDLARALGVETHEVALALSGVGTWSIEIQVRSWSASLLDHLGRILDRTVIRDFALVPIGLENAVLQALTDEHLAEATLP